MPRSREGRFGPRWPRLPWQNGEAKFRFPYEDVEQERWATAIERLWCREDLSPAGRRELFDAARVLERCARGVAACLNTNQPASGCNFLTRVDGTIVNPDDSLPRSEDMEKLTVVNRKFGPGGCWKCATLAQNIKAMVAAIGETGSENGRS